MSERCYAGLLLLAFLFLAAGARSEDFVASYGNGSGKFALRWECGAARLLVLRQERRGSDSVSLRLRAQRTAPAPGPADLVALSRVPGSENPQRFSGLLGPREAPGGWMLESSVEGEPWKSLGLLELRRCPEAKLPDPEPRD